MLAGVVLASQFGLADETENLFPVEIRGVRIVSVESNSIFQRLGLKSGDVVRKINQKPVRSRKELEDYEERFLRTGTYVIDLSRDGKDVTLTYSARQ